MDVSFTGIFPCFSNFGVVWCKRFLFASSKKIRLKLFYDFFGRLYEKWGIIDDY